MLPITDKKNKSYKKQKVRYIYKQGFRVLIMIIKIIIKSEIIVTTQENARGAAHSICNLRYKTTEQIPIVLHNGSTYDYHFI